jgi:hypothetical protein
MVKKWQQASFVHGLLILSMAGFLVWTWRPRKGPDYRKNGPGVGGEADDQARTNEGE